MMPKEWMIIVPYGDEPLSELAARELHSAMEHSGLVAFVIYDEAHPATLGPSGAV